jgi:cytochrome c oxidase assembly factor CtaG
VARAGATLGSVHASLVLAHAGGDEPTVPLTGLRWLTTWSAEPVPLLGAVLVGALYLLGVRRLRAAGNDWPISRTLLFFVGLGSFLVATQSALAAYDTVLLSVHMAQHMILAMIVPIFLALGAPVTLALRALPLGGRGRLMAVIHSRVAQVVTFPAVAGVIFVANPFLLYFTGYYSQTLRHPFLHDLNHAHFVLVGALWYWPLLGVDPMPRRLSHPLRMISGFLTLPFHAFLGVAIMSTSTLIAGDWYLSHERQWGASPLRDQQTAGGLLWASGDIVGLIVFGAIFRQWVKASEREARREDRRLDRLDAVNARRAAVAAEPPGRPDASVRFQPQQPREKPVVTEEPL